MGAPSAPYIVSGDRREIVGRISAETSSCMVREEASTGLHPVIA
jgi:hypothetical protein